MFNMSDLSTELYSIEKYIFSFKDTSLNSVALNSSDILPKQNPVGNPVVAFKSNYFFYINKQITIITIIMQTERTFCICFSKINTKFFLW